MSEDFDCIIVGAGLAGLSAARYLQAAGISVLVLESSQRPGGRVKSDQIDGYTLDHGFQVINPAYKEVRRSGILDHLDFTSLPIDLALAFKYEKFMRGVLLADPARVSRSVKIKLLASFVRGRPGLPHLGVGEFSRQFAEPIRNIHFEETVQRVENGVVESNRATYRAQFIVVATDPTTAVALVPEIEISEMLPSTTWYHSKDAEERGLGVIKVGPGPLINSIVLSDCVASYSPRGKSLISSTSLSQISESEVRRQAGLLHGESTSSWELLARYEIKQSLPLHKSGKPLRSAVEVRNGVFVVGDHREIPSQQGAMNSGRRAAALIIERVHQEQ